MARYDETETGENASLDAQIQRGLLLVESTAEIIDGRDVLGLVEREPRRSD